LTDLGGLAKKMPVTMITCMIAAFSISGVPGFNGYISKGMVIHAAALEHMSGLELALILGSVGTFLSFLKLTYFVFFRRNNRMEGVEVKKVPACMRIAMSATAFLCVAIGVYPSLLYRILPYKDVAFHYHAYELGHTIGTLELLGVTALLFFGLLSVVAPHEGIVRDIDAIFRRIGRGFIWFCQKPLMTFAKSVDSGLMKLAASFVWFSRNPVAATNIMVNSAAFLVLRPFNPAYKRYAQNIEELKKTYPGEPVERVAVGTGVLLTLVFLALYLLIYLIYA
ncbi:MAG: proton-conducting transporter transmembrane domain-containing protein, partial [Candidatus Methanospirareceae archaeon]